MIPNSYTVYSNHPQNFLEQNENKKVSYWLKKLFDQQEQKIIDDKVEKERAGNILKTQSLLAEVENKSPPFMQTAEKSPEEKGLEEHAKDQTKKIEVEKHTVAELVKKSDRCITSISSLFPWDLFPNTIRVEESRVTFIFRQFMTSQSHSVDISDISNVFIEFSLLFATLRVVSRTYIQNDIKIGYLKKKDAVLVRGIIEGLRIFKQNNIETSNYDVKDLIRRLEELHTN